MTVDEIVDAALSRGTEFGLTFPSARSVYYRRVAQRARELQSMLAVWSPLLTSADDTADVIDNEIDLGSLAITPTEIRAVLVEDAGSSEYEAGDQVSIIPPEDASGHLPPRVYFRGGQTLAGVQDDLTGLVSVRVFVTDGGANELTGDDEPATPLAHQELLVIDLTRFMATVLSTTPNANTQALSAILDTEEASRLVAFEQYAVNYASAARSRFSRDGARPSPTPVAGGATP